MKKLLEKRSRLFKKSALWVVVAASTLMALACAPSKKDAENGGKPPGKEDPIGGAGTFSGGGGNTIDGKPVEDFAKSIDSLPEFRQYILPLLKRLSREPADVLLVYLRWAASTKPWYFIPKKLESLSQSQTGLPFHSDQTARNTKDSVYIHEPSYAELSPKNRAKLLMHEMVMSARFLMKQTPQAQCLALSRAQDLSTCKDAEILKLGVDTATSEADRETLTASEHERVRLMTNYLLDEKQDITGPKVTAMRTRLGFHYPWDSMISTLKATDIETVLMRSKAAEDLFIVNGPSFADDLFTSSNPKTPIQCFINLSQLGQPGHLGLHSYFARETRPAAKPIASVQNEWVDVFAKLVDQTYLESKSSMTAFFHADQSDSGNSYRSAIKIRGIREADLPDSFVDQVTLAESLWPSNFETHLIDLFVSRGPAPRLLKFRISKVKVMRKDGANGAYDPFVNNEYIPVHGKKPVECRLQGI